MHLPEHIESDFSIDHNRESITEGMILYYACAGTVEEVKAVSDDHLILLNKREGTEWVAKRDIDGTNDLYSDFFPLTEN